MTSEQRFRNWTSKNLKLIILGKHKNKTREIKKMNIPLSQNHRELGFINFWHELPRKNFEYKVLKACERINPNYFIRAHKVALKACSLKPIHIYRWKKGFDEKFISESMEEIRKLDLPIDPYLPLKMNENQIRIMSGLPVVEPQVQKNKDFTFTFTKFKKPVQEVKKLRQTKIDEYFFPRSSTQPSPGLPG